MSEKELKRLRKFERENNIALGIKFLGEDKGNLVVYGSEEATREAQKIIERHDQMIELLKEVAIDGDHMTLEHVEVWIAKAATFLRGKVLPKE